MERIGKDHRATLIAEAMEWLAQEKDHQVFFLVPNYNKFEQEQEILAQLRKKMVRKHSAQRTFKSLVFYRLAWYLLAQTTLLSGNELSEAGSAMILRQIGKNDKKLTIFRGEIKKKGFIQQLQDSTMKCVWEIFLKRSSSFQRKREHQRKKTSN